MEVKSTTSKASAKCPDNTIWFYSKVPEFKFMSNFFAAEINIDGKIWPATEHYYQAMKYPTMPNYQEKIRLNKNPDMVKKMGRSKDGFRQDWERVKNDVMYKALVAKFTQHEDLKEKLLATGDKVLVEHTGRDKYWGDGGDGGNGTKGQNIMGKLLVKVRNAIREGKIGGSSGRKEPVATS